MVSLTSVLEYNMIKFQPICMVKVTEKCKNILINFILKQVVSVKLKIQEVYKIQIIYKYYIAYTELRERLIMG